MSWTDDQPPGLLAAADQELAGLRGWIRELAAEHPHVKEHMGAMEALFTLAKHIENAVDARPGMPNAWLIAAAAVDTLTATQADADKWERRYAEMLAQRDNALQEHAAARTTCTAYCGESGHTHVPGHCMLVTPAAAPQAAVPCGDATHTHCTDAHCRCGCHEDDRFDPFLRRWVAAAPKADEPEALIAARFPRVPGNDVHDLTLPAAAPDPADDHPERTCGRCGGPNTPWVAPSPLWNAVMRGGDINGTDAHNGIVCPTCFAILAEQAGIADLWQLSAKRVHVPLQTVTPSGRTWNAQTWLWDDAALAADSGETEVTA